MSEPSTDPSPPEANLPDRDAPDPNLPDLDAGGEQSPPGDEPVEEPDVKGQIASSPSAAEDETSDDNVAEAVPPNNTSDSDGSGTGMRPDLSGGGA